MRIKQEEYVKNELISYVRNIKKKTDISRDKHLCDHLLWLIDDYYILENAFLKTLLGKVLNKNGARANINSRPART